MEAFSLLKFWRNAGVLNTAGDGATAIGTTWHTDQVVDTEDEADDAESFFDLELTAPNCDRKECGGDDYGFSGDDESIWSDNNGDRDIDVARRNSESRKGSESAHIYISPEKTPFFKTRIRPLETISKPQSPISLLRSAPKFRVSLSRFRKSRSTERADNTDMKGVFDATPKHDQHKKTTQQSKLFSIRLNVEEVSMNFTRDHSWRSSGCKLQKQRSDEASTVESRSFPKDVVRKYIKLIKPLYLKVSKRRSEKMSYSGELMASFMSPIKAPMCSPSKAMKVKKEESEEKHVTLPAGLRVVCKHLGKSRSASSSAGVVPPASRRDDSLLQQHDGIQSAILHCKRSFNSSSSPPLSRSTSATSPVKPIHSFREFGDEERSCG